MLNYTHADGGEIMKRWAMLSLFVAVLQLFLSTSPVLADWALYEETAVKGMVSGTIKNGSILQLKSGSIYEVTGLTLLLVLELAPEVFVLKDGMQFNLIIDGFDEPLICKQLVPPAKQNIATNSLSEIQSKLDSLKRVLAENVALIAPAGNGPTLIETQIDGTFQGWEGDTIFIMVNGQIWQQVSYAYTYHYAYRPKVYLIKTYGTYKMKVAGVSGSIFVKQLR